MDKLSVEEKVENSIEWLLRCLRSDHAQTTGELESELGGMCCMGVAHVVCGISTRMGLDGPGAQVSSKGEAARYGLKANPYHMSSLNDTHGLTHYEIAVRVLSNPVRYLTDEVREGVLEYFCFRGDV